MQSNVCVVVTAFSVISGPVCGGLVGLCVGIFWMVSEYTLFLSVNYMFPWRYMYCFPNQQLLIGDGLPKRKDLYQ